MRVLNKLDSTKFVTCLILLLFFFCKEPKRNLTIKLTSCSIRVEKLVAKFQIFNKGKSNLLIIDSEKFYEQAYRDLEDSHFNIYSMIFEPPFIEGIIGIADIEHTSFWSTSELASGSSLKATYSLSLNYLHIPYRLSKEIEPVKEISRVTLHFGYIKLQPNEKKKYYSMHEDLRYNGIPMIDQQVVEKFTFDCK